jgi:hypothetical protein
MNRRDFGAVALGTLGATLTQKLWARESQTPASSRYFYFAVVADTHIIDSFYHGHESNTLDTESLYHASERLTSARDVINSLNPKIEHTFLVGDYFHNYPSPDYDFYFKNQTRLDGAKAITDGFKMPVHLGFGNHDYGVPEVSRELSHRLFRAKFNTEPYYAVDHKGWRFLHANNFLGNTWDAKSPEFSLDRGSLGEEQLNWLEAQLAERKPTFVFVHYPLLDIQEAEIREYGLHSLLRKYKDSIQLVISGHWHRWMDFAHTFGPQHYVMAATRYDANSFMLMEVDTQKQTWRFMNADLVEWATHYSRPYRKS